MNHLTTLWDRPFFVKQQHLRQIAAGFDLVPVVEAGVLEGVVDEGEARYNLPYPLHLAPFVGTTQFGGLPLLYVLSEGRLARASSSLGSPLRYGLGDVVTAVVKETSQRKGMGE